MNIMGGLRGRIMRAVSADALGQALNLGTRLTLTPLFIVAWGPATYGEWLVLTAIAGWFSLGDFGGISFFVNRMTSEWAVGNACAFQRLLSTGLLFLFLSSILLLGCVVFIIYTCPLVTWLGMSAVSQELANAILLLMALRFISLLPIGLFLGVYRAIGLQATSVMYGNLIILIQFALSFLALIAGGGMLLLAALELIPIFLTMGLIIWDLPRRFQNGVKLFSISSADKQTLRDAVQPSLHFFGMQLSSAIAVQGSVLVVAKVLGPVEVAIFSSLRIIANVLTRAINMFAHAATPEITRLTSLGESEKLVRLSVMALQSTLLVAFCYLFVVERIGASLFGWWLNDSLPYDSSVMFLLNWHVVIVALWSWGGSILLATNQHEEYVRWNIAANLFALTIGYLLGNLLGLVGIAVGLFLGQSLVISLILPRLLIGRGMPVIARHISVLLLAGLAILPAVLSIWSSVLLCLIVIATRCYYSKRNYSDHN